MASVKSADERFASRSVASQRSAPFRFAPERSALERSAPEFDDATASYQGHFAENDHIVSEEDRVVTESFIRLGGRDTDFHLYPGTRHWFFVDGDTFDADAAKQAWERTETFLRETMS